MPQHKKFFPRDCSCLLPGQRPRIVVAGGLQNGRPCVDTVEIYDVWARGWATHTPPALQNRGHILHATMGSTMYLAVCGRRGGHPHLYTLLRYDLDSNICEPLATLHELQGRHLHALLHYDGGLVFVASRHDVCISVLMLQPQTMTWSEHATCAPLGIRQDPAAFCILEGSLVMIGGEDDRGKSTGAVCCYDLHAQRWSLLPRVPPPAMHYATVVWDRKLVVVGTRACEQYDPATRQWSALPDLPTARVWTRLVAGGAAEEELFRVGGFDVEPRQGSLGVDRFDAVRQCWESCPGLTCQRMFPGGM